MAAEGEADTTLIGYARVSTTDQNPDRQTDALTDIGCHRIFTDRISGRTRQRPQLDAALEYLRPGDTLVVTSFDRLSRSLRDLIAIVDELHTTGVQFKSLRENIDTTTPMGVFFFHINGAFHQLQRDIIVENTKEGLVAARARGRIGGRPRVMTDDKIRHARHLLDGGEPISAVARALGVSRGAIYANMDAIRDG